MINGDKVVDFACLISTAAIGCCFIRRTLNTVECRIDLSRQLIFLSVRAAEINILQPVETKKWTSCEVRPLVPEISSGFERSIESYFYRLNGKLGKMENDRGHLCQDLE